MAMPVRSIVTAAAAAAATATSLRHQLAQETPTPATRLRLRLGCESLALACILGRALRSRLTSRGSRGVVVIRRTSVTRALAVALGRGVWTCACVFFSL